VLRLVEPQYRPLASLTRGDDELSMTVEINSIRDESRTQNGCCSGFRCAIDMAGQTALIGLSIGYNLAAGVRGDAGAFSAVRTRRRLKRHH